MESNEKDTPIEVGQKMESNVKNTLTKIKPKK
jgi:hypothetical protein